MKINTSKDEKLMNAFKKFSTIDFERQLIRYSGVVNKIYAMNEEELTLPSNEALHTYFLSFETLLSLYHDEFLVEQVEAMLTPFNIFIGDIFDLSRFVKELNKKQKFIDEVSKIKQKIKDFIIIINEFLYKYIFKLDNSVKIKIGNYIAYWDNEQRCVDFKAK